MEELDPITPNIELGKQVEQRCGEDQETKFPHSKKDTPISTENEIKHYISFCSDSDLSIYEPTITLKSRQSKSETDISLALHSSQDLLSPSLYNGCTKDFVPANSKQEEPEKEEDNATQVQECTTEETTECTDEELDYMVNLNYPFCQEEEDLDAIIKNNLPVDTTNCTSTCITYLINLFEK